jgi:hypothetical protein
MTVSDVNPSTAWSRRVRQVGGLIQAAFAAFWLLRGSLVLGAQAATALIATFTVVVVVVFIYAFRATGAIAPRPTGAEAKQIERRVTIATVIEFLAALVLPALVIVAGHSDWVLPSIAITIGPLLLYLDRLVMIPRYRPVGWVLTLGPLVLVAVMSDAALIATTGIGSGILLLGTAAAGFRDLARLRGEAAPLKIGGAPELAGSVRS